MHCAALTYRWEACSLPGIGARHLPGTGDPGAENGGGSAPAPAHRRPAGVNSDWRADGGGNRLPYGQLVVRRGFDTPARWERELQERFER